MLCPMSTPPTPSADQPPTGRRPPIRVQQRPPSLAGLDMSPQVGHRRYEHRLSKLQHDLKEISLAYRAQGRRAVVVFEGWDAAGKGGIIRRMGWPLDPRGFKVWAIAAPTPDEQGRHYLYRFWRRLPYRGQWVVFDRSWYGRVLVERIEGFATEAEWRRAYAEINEFERVLADDGIRLVKIFLHITPDEQLKRFRARLADPLKRWKLSEEDLRNRARWSEYETAIDQMFRHTSTVAHPWHLIPANDKRHARLAAIGAVVKHLSREVDLTPARLDPDFARHASETLGVPYAAGDPAAGDLPSGARTQSDAAADAPTGAPTPPSPPSPPAACQHRETAQFR